MKSFHALACVLLVVGAVLATPADSAFIAEKELEPYLRELWEQVQLIQRRQLQTAAVIARYERKFRDAPTRREQALYAYILSELYAAAGRDEEARRECDRALEVFPDFPAAHVTLGRLAFKKRDNRAARSRFDQALGIDANNIAARVWLARLEEMKGTEAGLNKARRLYEQSVEIRPVQGALEGLSRVCVKLCRQSFREKEKVRFKERAIGAAKGWRVLEPDNTMAVFNLAQVYVDLGMYQEAVEILEASCREDVPGGAKLAILDRLTQLYMQINRPKQVAGAIRRMLQLDGLEGNERKQLKERLKDVEGNGSIAFDLWEIDLLLAMLNNDGLPEDKRHFALRQLLDKLKNPWLTTEKGLESAQRKIFTAAMRVLITAPPKISKEMFKYFRHYNPHPRLIRILVHFVFPYDDDERTPDVRAAAVKTLAEVADISALPTLLYCLRDEPGIVLREVDSALVRVCERRSIVGEGVAPLTQEEKEKARRYWYRFTHSEEGTERLIEAYEELRKNVELNPKINREDQSQPLLDQTINVVLLDSDVEWPAWKAAYRFFVDYLGKDFRAVSLRDTPLQESQREAVVEAVRDWWRRSDPVQDETARPQGG